MHWKVGFQCLHIAAILIWMEIKVKFISSQAITGKDCYWLAPRYVGKIVLHSAYKIDFTSPKTKQKKD